MSDITEFKAIINRLDRIDRLLRQLITEVDNASESLLDQAISNRVEDKRMKSLLRVSLLVNHERKTRVNEKIKEST